MHSCMKRRDLLRNVAAGGVGIAASGTGLATGNRTATN